MGQREGRQRVFGILAGGAVGAALVVGIGTQVLPLRLSGEPSPAKGSTRDRPGASAGILSSKSSTSWSATSSSSRLSSSSSSTTTSTTAAAATDPGRVFVVGDSLTFTAFWGQDEGVDADHDFDVAAWMGWTAADVQPELDAAVAEGPMDTLVVALGANDSGVQTGDGGWTEADVERFRQLISTPGPGACVVIVLPGYGAGVGPAHAAEMDEARLDLIDLAQQRAEAQAPGAGAGAASMPGSTPDPDPDPGAGAGAASTPPAAGATVVVDWQAVIDARPELVAADGIHLAPDGTTINQVTPAAAAARIDLYWQGVDDCTHP